MPAGWRAAGALHVTSATYSALRNQPFGTLTLGVARGTLHGDYHLTGYLVPDSATNGVDGAGLEWWGSER